MPDLYRADWHPAADHRPQQDPKGGTLYQTNRQSEAEAIVRILHEMPDTQRMDENDSCFLCWELLENEHSESCPFRLADEFIAKYGTHPPAGPAIEPLVYPKAEEAVRR